MHTQSPKEKQRTRPVLDHNFLFGEAVTDQKGSALHLEDVGDHGCAGVFHIDCLQTKRARHILF